MSGLSFFWAIVSAAIVVFVFFGPSDGYRKFLKRRDASDPPEGRSHMKVMVDYGTGQEYLATVGMFGTITAITPRLPSIHRAQEETAADVRVDRVWKRSVAVWKSEREAELFLTRAHAKLEDRIPIDVVRESPLGEFRVMQILGRLEHGVAA